MPAIIARLVMSDGPQPRSALRRRPPPRPSCRPRRSRSAKVTSKMALATATPTAMIAPMNDWMLSVVRVTNNINTTPDSTAGTAATEVNASRTDWK